MNLSLAFILALAFAPSATLAQGVPPPSSAQAAMPTAAPSPVVLNEAAMGAALTMMSRLASTQLAARKAMLAGLTPAHRLLVSRIVGELAIAPNPDLDAAAKQLDAALSRSEIVAIGNARAAAVAQITGEAGALMQSLSPQQRGEMAQQAAATMQKASGGSLAPAIAKARQDANDPGHELLTTLLSGLNPSARFMRGALERLPESGVPSP